MSRSTTSAMRFATPLVAAVACVAAAQSASAAWYVAGTELTGSASLATTATVVEHVKLKAAGVTIECAGSSLTTTGGEIKAPNKLAVGSLVFNGCTANERCTVPSAIGTVPVAAELTEQTLQGTATFAAKTKAIFATIKYEGSACALAGVEPLTGKATVKFPLGEEEEALQELKANVSEGSSELKLGGSAAELKVQADLKLTSGLEFEWLAFVPSKEFLLSVDKRRLKKGESAVITVTSTKAGAEAVKIALRELPANQFRAFGVEECLGPYAAAKEECEFEVEYFGNEESWVAIELEDKVGDFRRRVVEGGP